MRMTKIVTAVGSAIVAISATAALAAPAWAEPDDPNQEQRDELFTKAVRDAGLRITPKKAISVAQSTCEVLQRTGNTEDALRHVLGATGWEQNTGDVATLGSLSVQAYCPTAMPQ